MENQNREIETNATLDDEFEEIVYIGALIGEYTIIYLCKQSWRTSEQTSHVRVQHLSLWDISYGTTCIL